MGKKKTLSNRFQQAFKDAENISNNAGCILNPSGLLKVWEEQIEREVGNLIVQLSPHVPIKFTVMTLEEDCSPLTVAKIQ